MRYRIKYIDDVGFFPQVKKRWFLPWKTIVKRRDGLFSLCDEGHTGGVLKYYGSAQLRCHAYESWCENHPAKYIGPNCVPFKCGE